MTFADWFDALASIATLGALIAAIYQLRQGNRTRLESEASLRSERAMKLYEEVVAGGDTAAAFHELSLYLRRVGSDQHTGADVTWHVSSDSDLAIGGLFSPTTEARERAFANLYTVLWFFERARAALESDVVDATACYRTLGFHVWWWDQLLLHVEAPKARAALTELALWATARAAHDGALADWTARCANDFDSRGPQLRETTDADRIRFTG